jgi:hypothetical protein
MIPILLYLQSLNQWQQVVLSQSGERQGPYPFEGCNLVNIWCLVTVLEEGAVSGIVQLAEVMYITCRGTEHHMQRHCTSHAEALHITCRGTIHHLHETYCILHMEFGWLRTEQYSSGALFWVICHELIINSIQSLV